MTDNPFIVWLVALAGPFILFAVFFALLALFGLSGLILDWLNNLIDFLTDRHRPDPPPPWAQQPPQGPPPGPPQGPRL